MHRYKQNLLIMLMWLMSPQIAYGIFYGEDDYVEIDQISKTDGDVDWRERAKSVAVIVNDPGQGDFDLSGLKPMRQRFRKPPLKPDYKYGQQPRLGKLTAFLIAPDKIMTAGHAGRRNLERSAFVFDFTWDSKNARLHKKQYQPAEIYRCKKVLLFRNDQHGDYAICLLDRPVTDRKPLTLKVFKNAGEVEKKRAKMISAPDGVPLKLTNAGHILSAKPTKHSPELNTACYFFHTLDNSYGSSGAPIFDAATGHVIGIQTGGDDNFTRVNGHIHPTRGNFQQSNLGRPLKGEWGCLIPEKAGPLVGGNNH